MVDDTRPPVGAQRPGGRGERVRSSVLRAAVEMLSEVGYEALSIERVAARAGVHKTTVYRRWPTKAALATAAISDHSAEVIPIADTGSFATDLVALARSVVANIDSEGGRRRAISLIVAASSSDDLAAGLHEFWRGRIAASTEIVTRAIQRGELPSDTDPSLVIETVVGPLWLRLLFTGEPLTDDVAEKVANLVTFGTQ